jgi:hypothetical protein
MINPYGADKAICDSEKSDGETTCFNLPAGQTQNTRENNARSVPIKFSALHLHQTVGMSLWTKILWRQIIKQDSEEQEIKEEYVFGIGD